MTATLIAAASSSKTPFLTTKNDLIVDETGKEVVLKGINWFGWNTNLDATGTKGHVRHFSSFLFFNNTSNAALTLCAKKKKTLSARKKEEENFLSSPHISSLSLSLSLSQLQKKNPGNFTNGADAVAQDAGWATARAAMMGFNAVRLPFRFRDVRPGRVPYNYTRLCGVPSQDDAKASSVDLRPHRARPRSRPRLGSSRAGTAPLP